jgi:hypothetical protein
MFRSAVCSDDLSFATALCASPHDAIDLTHCSSVLSVLALDGYLDHFLRSLSAAVAPILKGEKVPANHIELTALTNCFVSTAWDWATGVEQPGLVPLVGVICQGLQREGDLSPLAFYVLRAIFTIAAYEDAAGDVALAMFLEVVVLPFALKFKPDEDYRRLRAIILSESEDPVARDLRRQIEDTILSILGRSIEVQLNIQEVDKSVSALYAFALKQVDAFVPLVLFLNARADFEHPPVQTLLLALERADHLARFHRKVYQ